jgi:8-oxo-dGTP pyrophosphatase MutT (NUDIX family)
VLRFGLGLTNAAYRTTRGSGDLRRADFAESRGRLERLAAELRPRVLAFVGKEAYRGVFGERPELGPQARTLDDVGLFVLPSTSPANAAVPYAERLRWFVALREWSVPEERVAVRALVLDAADRTLLVEFRDPFGQSWWATPGGGVDEGEDDAAALARELAEELGLVDYELGPLIWTREHTFAWMGRLLRQRERIHLVRVAEHEPAPRVELANEGVGEIRWWSLDELVATRDQLVPRRLPELLRELLGREPPREPVDAGI